MEMKRNRSWLDKDRVSNLKMNEMIAIIDQRSISICIYFENIYTRLKITCHFLLLLPLSSHIHALLTRHDNAMTRVELSLA